jgi:hypothetical protein
MSLRKRVFAGVCCVAALSFCLPLLLRGQTTAHSCNRACLGQISDDYLQALAAHTPGRIKTALRLRQAIIARRTEHFNFRQAAFAKFGPVNVAGTLAAITA